MHIQAWVYFDTQIITLCSYLFVCMGMKVQVILELLLGLLCIVQQQLLDCPDTRLSGLKQNQKCIIKADIAIISAQNITCHRNRSSVQRCSSPCWGCPGRNG